MTFAVLKLSTPELIVLGIVVFVLADGFVARLIMRVLSGKRDWRQA